MGKRGKYQGGLGWWYQRVQVSRRQKSEGVTELQVRGAGGQEARGKWRKSPRMEKEGGRERKDTGRAQRNLRLVGRRVVAHKPLWTEALRKDASASIPAEPELSPTKSFKPRPSSWCGPGAGLPLSHGPIVPAVARGRKVYADGLCRRWARGEWGSLGLQAVFRRLLDLQA